MLLFISSCTLLKYLVFAPILNVLKVKMLCSWPVRATTRTGYMISCLIGLRKTKTLLRPPKDQGREKRRRCRIESRFKDTHDTIESFRTIDLSTLRTRGKFHQKVVFFIFLYWNYVTSRSSRTISFYQQPCLRLLCTMQAA